MGTPNWPFAKLAPEVAKPPARNPPPTCWTCSTLRTRTPATPRGSSSTAQTAKPFNLNKTLNKTSPTSSGWKKGHQRRLSDPSSTIHDFMRMGILDSGGASRNLVQTSGLGGSTSLFGSQSELDSFGDAHCEIYAGDLLDEFEEAKYNPLWTMKGYTQIFHSWRESRRCQSIPLSSACTYVMLPWWSIIKSVLDEQQQQPLLTFWRFFCVFINGWNHLGWRNFGTWWQVIEMIFYYGVCVFGWLEFCLLVLAKKCVKWKVWKIDNWKTLWILQFLLMTSWLFSILLTFLVIWNVIFVMSSCQMIKPKMLMMVCVRVQSVVVWKNKSLSISVSFFPWKHFWT